MATARPTVSVFKFQDGKPSKDSLKMPDVFDTPLRPDVVNQIFINMHMSTRQAHGIKDEAGYNTAAASWGTGRAVARIPRVPGSGTHRAGQGAFGNMCRGGGMFSPIKTWRRWARRTPLHMKRHAIASAIAGSGIPALVMARGHKIENVPELPLVVSKGAESVFKTKHAVQILKNLGCTDEMVKSLKSRHVRAGKGKRRGRRYVCRLGPLIVYKEDNGIVRAFRNLRGIEMRQVDFLSLMHLAPGGQMGRLIIWTAPAFERLQELWGSHNAASELKKNYRLMRPLMANPDLDMIINSDAIQSCVRPALEPVSLPKKNTKNPLESIFLMRKINPGASGLKGLALQAKKDPKAAKRLAAIEAKKRVALERLQKVKAKFLKESVEAFNAKDATAQASEDEEEE